MRGFQVLAARWLTITAGVTMLATGACGEEAVSPEEDGINDAFVTDGKADTAGIIDGSKEALGCLAVVNQLGLTDLKTKVGLASNAASAILAVRKGDDEVTGTADDVVFATLKQLDDVPYVGPVAFGKLLAYARANGFIGGPGPTGGNGPYGKWSPIKSFTGLDCAQAFWTGKEMIFWCGRGDKPPTSGAYDPATDTWRPLPSESAPGYRSGAAVAWSGQELFVFGGRILGVNLNDGYRYNPVQNKWSLLPKTAAPSARFDATMVWAGDRMIVFGGFGDGGTVAGAAEYIPSEDLWITLTAPSAPSPRVWALGAWTGREVIIWGGSSNGSQSEVIAGGGLYNPATRSWRAISTTNAPDRRLGYASAWTGTELLIWGGLIATGPAYKVVNDGARYNPVSNSWTALPAASLSARAYPSAVYTGSEFVIFGGDNNRNGARFVPATNSWRILSEDGVPDVPERPMAVWTGTRMLVAGGQRGAAWAP